MRSFLIILSLALAFPVQAAIYRCETPAGASFQESPCAEGASTEIRVKDYRIGTRALPKLDLGLDKVPRHRPRSYMQKARKQNDRACFSKRQQLETLQWKLRHGYKASAGEQMRQRRRQIEDYMRTFCR
ncbi:MAG: hypothetical protein KJ558_13870 [Gammaproteobacteria bacterium]|nr:hypothetical protein [Gammaproteobacteria bacterium]MBU1655880.1 hypothetical protein [Gammaproteobacteria bacterium]MBU1960623.1 hypothetical protein [Gammaproteobacteria bacterium]